MVRLGSCCTARKTSHIFSTPVQLTWHDDARFPPAMPCNARNIALAAAHLRPGRAAPARCACRNGGTPDEPCCTESCSTHHAPLSSLGLCSSCRAHAAPSSTPPSHAVHILLSCLTPASFRPLTRLYSSCQRLSNWPPRMLYLQAVHPTQIGIGTAGVCGCAGGGGACHAERQGQWWWLCHVNGIGPSTGLLPPVPPLPLPPPLLPRRYPGVSFWSSCMWHLLADGRAPPSPPSLPPPPPHAGLQTHRPRLVGRHQSKKGEPQPAQPNSSSKQPPT